MIIEFLGRHGEVLQRIDPPGLCVSISIREAPADDRYEHLGCQSSFPAWGSKRKIANLPDPPAEVR
jgi:hypothetical protein